MVVDFSGCPGDSASAKQPNWVTCPWPPDYLEVLKWQWDEVVSPYWTKHAAFARERGVSDEQVRQIIQQHLQPRTWGLLGEPRVNVLEVNLALDQAKAMAMK